jgi:hypothetical protein
VNVPGDVVSYSLNVGASDVGKPVSITVSERPFDGDYGTTGSYYFGAILELYGPEKPSVKKL